MPFFYNLFNTEERLYSRQQPPKQLPQIPLPEPVRACHHIQIQAIAEELANPARRDDNAFREPMLDDIQREDEGVDEGGRESVVGR